MSKASFGSLFARPVRLTIAGGLALLAVGLPVLEGAAAARHVRAAVQWMRALDLSSPAFWPAGTPQRHPQTLLPAVDLRLAPHLPGRSTKWASGGDHPLPGGAPPP